MNIRVLTIHTLRNLLKICTLLFFWGCEAQETDSVTRILQPSDSVSRDIPKFFQDEKWVQHLAKLQLSLNLQTLQNGVTDWQIRLWVAHGDANTDSTQLIILKKENGCVSGILNTYVWQELQIADSIFVTSSGRFTSLFPGSGWDMFIDSLNKSSIYTLPDYTKLTDYFLSYGSYGVTFEVATKNQYRIYRYPDYERHVGRIKEAGNVLQILRMIEREFGIKVIY